MVGIACLTIFDKMTDPCLKEPSNPRCKNLAPTDGNVNGLVNDLSIYILLFTGIFELLRSVVGLKASGKEHVGFARFYMRTWFVVIAGGLYAFAYGLADPSVGISLYRSLGLVESLYYTMVAWSFYKQLERKNERSVSNEELTTGLTRPDIEMA